MGGVSLVRWRPLKGLGVAACARGVVTKERWHARWYLVRRSTALRQPDGRLTLATFIAAGYVCVVS